MTRQGRFRKMIFWGVILCLVAGLFAAVAAFNINQAVVAAGKGRIYAVGDKIPHKQVALVLGARVYKNGRLSQMLADRVDAAITLYKAGVVQKLLMSGDNRTENYNEVTAMRNYAIRHGVPSNDVVRDFAGFRTYDSIYRAKELWKLNEMIIVSQRFHLPRAIYIARHLGIDAVGVEGVHKEYRSLKHAERREIGARILAWFDVMIGRDPYFLGPKESLSGDAQQTRVAEPPAGE